jgi:Cobalamin biosynthesis protein CbiK, Co2+ chelatase
MENAILAVSFGTSRDETREKNIAAVERALAARFPDFEVRRAFTSGMIRRSLAKRGIQIDGVSEALAALRDAGCRRVLVQPTHLLPGEEYDLLFEEAAAARNGFEALLVGSPLLAGEADMEEVLNILDAGLPRAAGEAAVLMGHGTDHACNGIYSRMNALARAGGHPDFYIGTVEARPSLSDVIGALQSDGRSRAVLTPLMLVAGEHARTDMTGGGESWEAVLRGSGIAVRPVLRGLGEYPAIRELYCRHAEEAMRCWTSM